MKSKALREEEKSVGGKQAGVAHVVAKFFGTRDGKKIAQFGNVGTDFFQNLLRRRFGGDAEGASCFLQPELFDEIQHLRMSVGTLRHFSESPDRCNLR